MQCFSSTFISCFPSIKSYINLFRTNLYIESHSHISFWSVVNLIRDVILICWDAVKFCHVVSQNIAFFFLVQCVDTYWTYCNYYSNKCAPKIIWQNLHKDLWTQRCKTYLRVRWSLTVVDICWVGSVSDKTGFAGPRPGISRCLQLTFHHEDKTAVCTVLVKYTCISIYTPLLVNELPICWRPGGKHLKVLHRKTRHHI